MYEIEKSASSMEGMLSISEWKARLTIDADVGAVDLVDAELVDALDAAGEAGWQGEVQGEPRIFVLPAEENFEFGFMWTGLQTTMCTVSPFFRRRLATLADNNLWSGQ
ncbi:hypothetical protein [Paraburkholderia dioscoreae]|uniref:hypothetical protein n=1 Tax=Paraburkholderia dioscoreae TaxID=2604047 RepID=UPI0013EAE808|nr:hypothetical protein [Paraburkholderia dioscoreae]